MAFFSQGAGAEVQVRMTPENVGQGEAYLVTVSSSEPLKDVRGEWRGKAFSFYPAESGRSYSAALGIDLDEEPGRYGHLLSLTDEKGHVSQAVFGFEVLKREFPVQRLTLPKGMVTLSSKNLSRVRRESEIVRGIWQSGVKKKLWKREFMVPLEGEVISGFGLRRILNNKPRNPHSGVDLRASAETPVLASSDGVVAFTGEHFFSGKCVYLDHGLEIFTMYFHLSEIRVSQGQQVNLGQVIGTVGSTGRATGPHLHWGVRIGASRVDPFSLVRLFQ